MPQYRKRPRRGERLTVWIDGELYEALRTRAFRERKSLSMLVGELLASALGAAEAREERDADAGEPSGRRR